MMYNVVMHRTQVDLGAEEDRLLTAASAESGASRAELIRRAVRAVSGRNVTTDRLALRASAGVWADRDEDGAAYVEGIRVDLTRLRSLGID
jgi:hypothetical protein